MVECWRRRDNSKETILFKQYLSSRLLRERNLIQSLPQCFDFKEIAPWKMSWHVLTYLGIWKRLNGLIFYCSISSLSWLYPPKILIWSIKFRWVVGKHRFRYLLNLFISSILIGISKLILFYFCNPLLWMKPLLIGSWRGNMRVFCFLEIVDFLCLNLMRCYIYEGLFYVFGMLNPLAHLE